MTEYESDKKKKLIGKLVSNSRRIISNQIALPLGIHTMTKILGWINDIEPLEFNSHDFFEYDSELKDYPVGTDRLEYHIDKLIEYENQIRELNEQYRPKLMRLCKEIIDKYGAQQSALASPV